MVQKWNKSVAIPPKTVLSGNKSIDDLIGYKSMDEAVADMAKKEYTSDSVFQRKVLNKFKISKF